MPASGTALRRAALALTASLALLALPGALRAQIVGVPVPPPRPAPAVLAADTVDPNRPTPWRADTAAIVQRLDIQAWVDSAAPALARAPRPAPAVVEPVPRADPAPPAPLPPTPPAAAPNPRLAPTAAPRLPRRPSQEARDREALPSTPPATPPATRPDSAARPPGAP